MQRYVKIMPVKWMFIFLLSVGAAWAGVVQAAIDQAPAGARIVLPAGQYAGPIRIDKPLILEGEGSATAYIRGDGNGTVIAVHASHVTLRNITIAQSGKQKYRFDSGITVHGGSDIVIEGCRFRHVLYGIILDETDHAILRGNHLTAYPETIVDNRGDLIRLWGVHHVTIAGNRLDHGRDVAIIRSRHVVIRDNTMVHGRYGVLIQMGRHMVLRSNQIEAMYAGVRIQGGRGIRIEHNRIIKSLTPTGAGIMLSGGSDLHVADNQIARHAHGLYIDAKAKRAPPFRYIERNHIALNHEAFHFHGAVANNIIRFNVVRDNLADVVKDIASAPTVYNTVTHNRWDRYEGFDADHDGIGDTPYQVLVYADRMWHFAPHVKFFYASPVLSLLNLIEKIAPFEAPILLLEDPKPLY